jgi:hypothetical protein
LNAAQIGMRCGDKKTDALTYSILSDNWYVIVLPPVEEEIRRVIRNERAKDTAYRSVRFWGHGRPGRGVTPSARPATSPSVCGNEATARSGDEAQTALHIRRGLLATVWCRREADIADHGLGRLNCADSGPTGVTSGRAGVPTRGRPWRGIVTLTSWELASG